MASQVERLENEMLEASNPNPNPDPNLTLTLTLTLTPTPTQKAGYKSVQRAHQMALARAEKRASEAQRELIPTALCPLRDGLEAPNLDLDLNLELILT